MKSATGSTTTSRLLIVDDHPTIQRMIRHALADLDLDIHTASTGIEAIALAKQLEPAVILLDIMLPDISGIEVCHRIQSDTSIPRSSIIFLSGITDIDFKIESFAQGGADYINKPFEPMELRARVLSQLHIRKLENRLLAANLQLEYTNQHLLETISEGIIGTNAEHQVTFINPSAKAILGIDSDCSGLPIDRLLPLGSPGSGVANSLSAILTAGRPYTNKCVHLGNQAQREIALEISCNPIVTHQRMSGSVVCFKDITADIQRHTQLQQFEENIKEQRKQLSQMERAYTLGEMAAGFAHEIKQPLSSINNFANASINIANNNFDKEKIIGYLRQIQQQSERAGLVIDKLRAFITTPESGHEQLSLAKIIDETLDFISHEITTHNISLQNKIDVADSAIIGDRIQIQQTLINVIKNAIDAMNHDSSNNQIEIHLTNASQPNYITVIISDNGKGVPKEMWDTLFHPFKTSKANGMGIGLSICESIMRAHHGFISFDSSPGLTSFYLHFPMAKAL